MALDSSSDHAQKNGESPLTGVLTATNEALAVVHLEDLLSHAIDAA
jgi:hypothetical protein